MSRWPNADHWADDDPDLDFLHEMASRLSHAPPLADVLKHVVGFATSVVKCDSCFVYVLEKDDLVLRASKNPHPEIVDRLTLKVGQGITGWVAEHREPVVVPLRAFDDPRFKTFNDLPEDYFEAFLSVPLVSRGQVVGVVNLQHRKPHLHTKREIKLISMIGFLVGAEIEMARLESENAQLTGELGADLLLERAKEVLQRDLKISGQDAYLALQRESQQRRKSVKEVAEAVLLTEELKRAK
jgi:signal transduction protein with GAF and PtsI domain